jgi:hypothetical protein
MFSIGAAPAPATRGQRRKKPRRGKSKFAQGGYGRTRKPNTTADAVAAIQAEKMILMLARLDEGRDVITPHASPAPLCFT